MIFKVDDPKKAESVLRAKGIRIVQQEEMAAL
jgi:hypothetical protein